MKGRLRDDPGTQRFSTVHALDILAGYAKADQFIEFTTFSRVAPTFRGGLIAGWKGQLGADDTAMNAALRGGGTVRVARELAWLPVAILWASAAFGLGGCASISEKMSEPLSRMPGIGMRAEAPERPAEVRAYPAVHEMPPPRTTATLDGSQQTEMEKELVKARETQKTYTTPAPQPPPPKPAVAARKKPASNPAPTPIPNVVPASSSRMIY
jgi:hypothetical protein